MQAYSIGTGLRQRKGILLTVLVTTDGLIAFASFHAKREESQTVVESLELADDIIMTVNHLAGYFQTVTAFCGGLESNHAGRSLHQITAFREEPQHRFNCFWRRSIWFAAAHLYRNHAFVILDLCRIKRVSPKVIKTLFLVGRQLDIACIEIVGGNQTDSL